MWYCEALLVKIPVIKELRIFNQSRYCKDHGNQGPDNQGPAVASIYFLWIIDSFENLILSIVHVHLAECNAKIQGNKNKPKNLCSLLYAKTRWCRKLRKPTAQKKRILAPFEFYYSKISQGRGATYLAFFLYVPTYLMLKYKAEISEIVVHNYYTYTFS